jgi:alanyl-tRNA synthetase
MQESGAITVIERRIFLFKTLEEGAMALFGEMVIKCVRLNWRWNLWWNPCKTAEIWHFKIVSEGAVAAGIRRIEAITSDAGTFCSV